jgi:virginiamycin B lyase
VTEFHIPAPGGPAIDLAVGPDRAIWLSEWTSTSIGRFADGQFSNFPVRQPGFPMPGSIVDGPDGALWFTDVNDDLIWRMTTDGRMHGFPIPVCAGCRYSGGSGTGNIVVGADGALWYSRPGNDAIGRITTTGNVREFPITVDYPGWITSGPDGAIWFTGSDGIYRMGLDGQLSHPLSGFNYPASITSGPDGKLWFIGIYQDEVGSLTTDGQKQLFHLGSGCSPEQISAGPRVLWVACGSAHTIYRVSTKGVRTAFAIPSDFSTLSGIVQAPDRSVWFTAPGDALLGRLVLR